MASVSKRKDGSYYFREYCGMINGKRVNRYMTWRPEPGMTQKQINRKLDDVKRDFERECREGILVDNSITFEKYVNEMYLPQMQNVLKKATFVRYELLLRRIIPALGFKKLKDIGPRSIEAFIDDLAEAKREDIKYRPNRKAIDASKSGTRNEIARKAMISTTTVDSIRSGKNVSKDSAERFSKYLEQPVYKLFEAENEFISPKTILHHFRLLSAIFENAKYDGIIINNPCDRVRAPKVDDGNRTTLQYEQIQNLLEAIEKYGEHPFDIIIKLLLYTGIRRGECLALTWSDILFDEGLININKSLLYLPNIGTYEDTPKTKTSKRVIKVGEDVMEILREYKKWQESEAIKLGDKRKSTNRLFTAWNGEDINPGTVTKWFKKIATDIGVPEATIHSLRHTNASIMIANNVDLATTSKRLGHSSVEVTTRIYAHEISIKEAAASEAIDLVLTRK